MCAPSILVALQPQIGEQLSLFPWSCFFSTSPFSVKRDGRRIASILLLDFTWNYFEIHATPAYQVHFLSNASFAEVKQGDRLHSILTSWGVIYVPVGMISPLLYDGVVRIYANVSSSVEAFMV